MLNELTSCVYHRYSGCISYIEDLISRKQHSSTLTVELGPGQLWRALHARKSTTNIVFSGSRPRKRRLESTRKHSLETGPKTVTRNHPKPTKTLKTSRNTAKMVENSVQSRPGNSLSSKTKKSKSLEDFSTFAHI